MQTKNIISLTRKTLYGIMLLAIFLSAFGGGNLPSVQAQDTLKITPAPRAKETPTIASSTNGNQCRTYLVLVTLNSEQISFCAPTNIPSNTVEDNVADPNVTYAQFNQITGYGIVNIKSIAKGNSPGIGRPIYNSGKVVEYRQEVWDTEVAKSDRVVSNGPVGVFWNEYVSSIQIDLTLETEQGDMSIRSIEWYVEHNGHLWSFLIAWDTKLNNDAEWLGTSNNFYIGKPNNTGLPDTAIDLGAAFQKSRSSEDVSISGTPVDVGPPSWWGGTCNNNNYFPATGIHSILLGTSWHGVPSCGPRPFTVPNPDHLVYFFPGAHGEYEFECVELVMRFLFQEWSIAPWAGNGNTIKNSPPSSIVFYSNGSNTMVPGDILTENGSANNPNGHTAIITSVNLDGNGTGTIGIFEQNASPSGGRSLHVTNWSVDPDAYSYSQTIQGWLHANANGGGGGSGNVGGRVLNSSGQQVVIGANVWAVSGGSPATTDGNGIFIINNVPAGSTTIKASHPIYGIVEKQWNVIASQDQQIGDIKLVPPACIPGNGMSQVVGLDSCSPGSTIDNATFISDITLPDGTVVSPSEALTKTWRVKNTGTSTWGGYKLKFTDGEQMGGTSEIAIATTAPGATVDISINLVSPSTTGLHSGSWQIVNQSGMWVPGGLLWVKINVGSQSGVITLTTDPSSPASAGQVNIYARVNNFPNLRALRILVDGQQLCELGAPEIQDCVWHTSGYAAGQHSIVAEADDFTGLSWDNPERKTILFELTGSGVINHGPYRPILVQNPAYDWYVTIGNAPQLCAQQQGDPDGDAISQYRFVASASVGTVDSGWVGNFCYTFSSITPGTYEWHAQVKDSLGGISDWSDNWHFTVEPTGVTATINSFSTPSPSNAEEIKIFACSSGHAGINITLRVLVNDATDGSDSGEWHIIKEQGSPCFNDIDAPVWRTLEYGDGPHKVRVVAMAIQPDAGNVYDTIYTLNHRRPNSPRLVAPVSPSGNMLDAVYLNSRTVTFKWEPAIRATNYTLHVSTNSSPQSDPAPIFRQSFTSSINEFTVTLGQDYPTLYWQVEATNDIGSNASGAQRFGIDRQIPACTVSGLPATTYANVFQVNWNNTDNLAGIKTADIQFMDSERGTWEDWLTSIPFDKTYDLFDGQPGHSYFFRCRATDNANNTGNYPASANTSITIDPFTRPGTPWWNTAYGQKRNIVILNNMGGTPLPQGYPIHLHFDNSTAPTAATLYAASLSSSKCNDLRIIYGDAIQLDRIVQQCTSSVIDIWFRSQISVAGGGTNNTSHQLYYGNSSAGSPPANQGNVFYPSVDANTIAAWYMSEGQGSTLNDLSGNGHSCIIYSPTSWITPAKFPGALNFSGGSDSQTVDCGISSAYNLQNFTFETYFKSTNNNLWGKMAGNTQSNSQRWILETIDNKPSVWIWTTNGDTRFTVSQSYTDNIWHHLAFTVNGTQVMVYIDGQLKTTGNLPANIRSDNLPLTIGSAESNARTFAEMTGVRLSNVVRTDFSYGAFVNVTNEPSIVTDSVVNPPVTGAPDLTILSLSTYPNPQGGVLVEAVVENQGDLSTQSGFYTDLYLNHVPTGAGDYSNSLRFWINDPIAAGQTTTLTTVITDLSTLSASTMPGNPTTNVVSTFTESSGILYAQTDSAGLVQEPDNQNNIYSSGIQVCTATSDTFENDNTYATASLITIGNNQTHNFSFPGDNDWIKFSAQAGKTYRLTTGTLGVSADTYLYLYDVNGTTLISSNDDSNGSLASQIKWTAPQNGTYYALVKHWNPSSGGCGTQYNLTVTVAADLIVRNLFLPLILR